MESKFEVSNCLKVFLNETKIAGHTIKEFLSDGENWSNQREGKTPIELWSASSFNVRYLKVFGTKFFVHVPKQRRQKLDPKSVAGFFVGYCGEKDGYRVWLKEHNKIILSRDSVDHGSEIELITSSDVPDSDVCEEIGEASCDAVDSKESSDEQERNLIDRSMLKKPARYDNCVLLAEHAETDTYKEAIATKESSEWLAAMKEEMTSLEANNTWELMNLPQDRKAIGSRWVYKIKKNADGTVQRFKARLVARGYSQKVGVDFNETFSPVERWDTIRTVLSVAAYKKLKLVQFDVKTAFLYGDLQGDIYMHQPQGFEDGSGQVSKLLKSIYGLKQAPKVASVDEQAVKQFLEKLKSEFSVVIGAANYFLGMQIECLENGDIFVHQEGYCRKILKHFEMSECNSVSTSVEKGTITTDHSEFLPATVPYREAIGSLMFLAIVSRPDITFAVGVLSQVLHKPQQVHWSMIKRIMCYLKGTEKCGILFQCNEDNTLECFTDAVLCW
ncbi:Retrovirus-related Pol polyprotein from transposon TNT 1-94 [Araneus ventricosus]|uniref:Retrovirus-related Pol polyprotein from transposon TNT 1-94 n=1 Tax=Araneus ventricosus TaxID=182803 RepID=A0A4Y2P0V2_ARAVE|nr:Retrovirus-related Pol polyprotein from transposon TNT 1-94 [Araneus ventricosus]